MHTRSRTTISFIIAYVNNYLVYIGIVFISYLIYYIIIKKRKDILRMKSRNTFKKGSCELLVLHILNKKGDCYGYELGQIIRDITNEYLSFPEGSMYPVLYKMIDNGYITDYKKQVGKRMTRVYYHIEPSGQDRLEELTQEYLKTTQSIKSILNFDFENLQSEDTLL